MTDPQQPSGLLEVGVVRRPHGVKGDTSVELMTDREDRLAVGSRLWAKGAWRTVATAKHLPQRWLVHFEGFDDRTAIETLTNAPLMAEPVDDPDALWVHDLIGARVVEVGGVDRGTCIGVLANPAHAHWMAENAARRAHELFNWDRIATMTRETYERVWREFQGTEWV